MQKIYSNPIIPHSQKENTSDPFVVRYGGKYYHCYANPEGVFISESDTLFEIGSATPVKIYDCKQAGTVPHWYAPELHFIDGSWYVYGAPDYGNDKHTMSVLCCKGDNPLGEYTYAGKMRGLENSWNIDGTPFYYLNTWWFSWTDCNRLYMAEMDGPLGIKGDIIILSRPEYAFERQGSPVNEGPAPLIYNGKLFMVYSASDSKVDGYCLGLLEFLGDNKSDMLKNDKWYKNTSAVFEKIDKIFGPGHCSFTKVNNGELDQDYMVYHANVESGTGWNGRSVWLKKITFDQNGKPVFGRPETELQI